LFPFLIGLAGLRQTIIFAEFSGISKGSGAESTAACHAYYNFPLDL